MYCSPQGLPPQGYGQPPIGYAPQQPYYGQQAMGQQQAVIVTQPVVLPQITVVAFGDRPIQVQCPHCQATVLTDVSYEAGVMTWLLCVIILVIGCWFFCCLIPFCIDSCKDVVHTCPNCRRQISYYKRRGV
jgi:lipopolysaccharide-induced tumor necrosis factor-alpha factor